MKNIIENLREAYINNKAEALNLLPQLFKEFDEEKYKIGDIIYCIEYDSDEEKYDIAGYVYVAENEKCIICSSSYCGRNNKQICKTLLEEQKEDSYVEMHIFDKRDVYKLRKEAEKALKERKNEKN